MMLLLILLAIASVSSGSKDPNFSSGRSTIVHLFEWKWSEIAKECDIFLGPYGYGGVQTSPPNENGIVWEPFWNKNVRRPWFERYQPVSYKLETRSGNETEFKDMVERCNKAGVRIYPDLVINHMTGDIGRGQGTGGSYFEPDKLRYDGVPYGALDFNSKGKCGTNSGNIENYQDSNQVRNCKLSGLNDLDLGKEYVRNKIVEYMNKLIAIGVAGFRIDAAKHMWPVDLQIILGRLNNLNTSYFPANARPLVFMEVIDLGGEPIANNQYTHLGRVTEFKFGKNLGDVIRKNNNQKLKYLRNFGEGWGMLCSENALAFIDNHDNQRGHGAGGFGAILTHFEARMYKMATAFMMAWPYAVTRMMSSYAWNRTIENGKDVNDWVGPPHDNKYNTKSVIRNPDLTCGNGWICEHRWRQMYNMVKFRNVVGFEALSNWWDNDDNQIAFGRGNRGFIAINNDWRLMDICLQTGLPKGSYCDVISGNKEGNKCTGKTIEVDENGHTQIHIPSNAEDPIIAIHVHAKL